MVVQVAGFGGKLLLRRGNVTNERPFGFLWSHHHVIIIRACRNVERRNKSGIRVEAESQMKTEAEAAFVLAKFKTCETFGLIVSTVDQYLSKNKK